VRRAAGIVGLLAFASVAWSVLTFGGVYPWTYWPLIALLGITGSVSLVTWVRLRRAPGRLPLAVLVSLGAVAAAIGAQAVPIPRAMIVQLSPATDAFLRQHDLAYAAGAAQHPLSIDPAATRRAFAFVVALTVLLASLTFSLTTAAAQSLSRRIAALATVVAAIGIAQQALVTSGKVYGLWTPQQPGTIFGPFVNKNHFAGWMLMALPLSLGVAFGYVATAWQQKPPPGRRLLWLASPEANKLILSMFVPLVMGLSLVLTQSRSGITAFAIATAFAAAAALRARTTWTRRIFLVVYAAAILVVAIRFMGVDALVERFGRPNGDVGGRIGAWHDAERMAHDFPVTGVGINAFGQAMLDYQSTMREFHYSTAHNDWLQVWAEGGWLVGIPALFALLVFIREIVKRFREGDDDPITYSTRAAAVTALLAIALQECFDFSLQIPANAVLFTVLIAIAIHRTVRVPVRVTAPQYART